MAGLKKTLTRHLTILHIHQKKMLAKFVHNYNVEKENKFQGGGDWKTTPPPTVIGLIHDLK